jgi:prepilin-type N-terminal cleavage/methylation domain-containing protein
MNKGFTLIEIAIVLVIIGILAAGIVRSTVMIDSARSKQVLTDIAALVDAQHRFFERTGRYAGDTDNDGQIDFATISSDPTINNAGTGADVDQAFTELEQLSIIPTDNNTAHATPIEGGPMFFASADIETESDNVRYNVLAVRNITCLTAYQLELNIDGNAPDVTDNATTGRIRLITGGNEIEGSNGVEWSDNGICPDSDTGTTSLVYLFDRF